MSTLDPFGRPLGGAPRPIPGGRRTVSGLRACVVAFIAFDLVVLALVGSLFAFGVLGGGSDTVVIPPASADAGDVAVAASEDDDDDDDDVNVGAVVKAIASDDDGPTTATAPAAADPVDDDEPAVAVEPAGLNASSMIRERNLRPALAEAKRLAPGRVTMLSLHPTHFMAQVRSKDGAQVTVNGRIGQGVSVMSRTPGVGSAKDGVAWSTIDPAAPERLTRALKAGGETGQRSVSHLVVMPVFAPWALHRKNGERIPASANGTPRT